MIHEPVLPEQVMGAPGLSQQASRVFTPASPCALTSIFHRKTDFEATGSM
jgi:hypothetical protein